MAVKIPLMLWGAVPESTIFNPRLCLGLRIKDNTWIPSIAFPVQHVPANQCSTFLQTALQLQLEPQVTLWSATSRTSWSRVRSQLVRVTHLLPATVSHKSIRVRLPNGGRAHAVIRFVLRGLNSWFFLLLSCSQQLCFFALSSCVFSLSTAVYFAIKSSLFSLSTAELYRFQQLWCFGF